MKTVSASATVAPTLRAMAGIEARRFARHPLFVVGVVAALAITAASSFEGDRPGDVLSWPVIAAFFIGLPSLIVAARLTRSTETADEAVATTPGTEAQRTLALAVACLVPLTAGLAWLVEMLVLTAIRPPAPQEWWFATVSNLHVISVLVAGGPVACLGGGLLGVLTGRWLRFPGAAAVVVLGVVIVCMLSQAPVETSRPTLRMWAPYVTFQSGTDSDGTATLYAGSAFFYLLYALCLCAAAVIGAVWHDRAARTGRLVQLFAGVVVLGLVFLVLGMNTGVDGNQVSDPVPAKVRG